MNHTARLFEDTPLALESGAQLSPVDVAYTLTGRINNDGDNVILVCHALTGDQYVASDHPITGKPGWWARLVGPGKLIDTSRFAVVCANVLGGCMGSTGPASPDPATGQPYGMAFPIITLRDMVRAQQALMDHLGVARLALVIGGSMGGMQVLEWLATTPERVGRAAVIAAAARHTAQNIALHEIGRQAIMGDANWAGGAYYASDKHPTGGLAIARMIAHVSYLSDAALGRKFGRNLQDRPAISFGFDADFQVESYLRHQGSSFTRRFDANSYLYITRAMDYFDLAARHGGILADAFAGVRNKPVDVLSVTSDWLYPTAENRIIADALKTAGAEASMTEIESDAGHDAFLLDIPALDNWLGRIIAAL